MRFLVENDKPSLVSGGRVYPVEITAESVRVDLENGTLSEQKGTYCLQEIVSKFGQNVSSIPKRRRKKQED